MGEYRELFKHNFGRLLLRENVSSQDVAEEIGVSEVTLSRWRTGVSLPSDIYIEGLADYFKVEIREFWKPVRKGK